MGYCYTISTCGPSVMALPEKTLAPAVIGREAVGPGYEILTDGNQGFTLSEAIRRAQVLEDYDIGWFEEPLPADDVAGHAELSRRSSVPITVGESMYSLSQFKDFLQAGAASIVQVDAARVGGITLWLKVAHLAEAYNMMVCSHFLMEQHLPLVCAVPNAKWLEYIPQLDNVTTHTMQIEDGCHSIRYAGSGRRVGLAGYRCPAPTD
ncbi:enolase C-terminal domain-like protein [Ruegeria sp. MALMAid1280]|uniref:enolase C-terminal domain-like protein n=1 Tax=Ruegeria sp. MALMAid1280 TaxID=3411634 RepID=UPI003BA2D9DB